MKKKFLFRGIATGVMVLIFGVTTLIAQVLSPVEPISFPVEGFIIQSTGDTVKGKVAVIQQVNYVTRIAFWPADGTKKVKIDPAQIRGFVQKRPVIMRDFSDLTTISQDWVFYDSRPNPKNPEKIVFMERLLSGRISIYDNPTGMKSTSGFNDLKISESAYSYLVAKDGGEPVLIRSMNYDEHFAALFADCPAVNDFILKNDLMRKFTKLPYLANFYNNNCKK